MDVFWITFRVENKTVGGREYLARYNAMIDALSSHCVDHWEEPTSFFLLKSNSSATQIAASVKSAIAPSVDLVVIGSMNYTGITVIGRVADVAQLIVMEQRIAWA